MCIQWVPPSNHDLVTIVPTTTLISLAARGYGFRQICLDLFKAQTQQKATGLRRRESFRILARSAEGRGRSTLLSVLPFMDNSVCDGGHIHSEVCSQPSRADPDTLHFQGPAAARARSLWRSTSCQLWLARLPLPRLQIQSQRGLASLRRHSCLAGACGAMLSCGFLRLSFLSVRLPWWR